MYSKELYKGTLSTVILKLLKEHGEMYGYEITKMVSEITDGEISIKEGSLYPALHRMEKEGVIKARLAKHGKRVRKYYSLTKESKGIVAEKIEEFNSFIATINKILNPKLSSK